MCGIFGIISYRNSVDRSQMQTLTGMLKHRGPDDEGFYYSKDHEPHVALGHRRLSIIDLSPNGHQPMSNEDGTLWIVFNGEIYNFYEHRRDLEEKGHIFRSDTDTETILHLYEEHGTNCLRYLRGMFAFAIWDEKRQTLFAARDRLGKKPFYYASTSSGFYFSSEINPLYRIEGIDCSLDFDAIDLYMTYSYIPSPRTILKGILKLPPAHYLLLEQQNLSFHQYWNLSFGPKLDISFRDAQQLLEDKIREATSIRLYSDVPLGCFLSGGVDSSLVLATMAGFSSRPVKTFSIGFPHRNFDETPYARQAAQHYGTDHQEFVVTPSAVEILSDLVRHYGEPYGDPSALPTWYLSELTRKYVTVVLNGDGGDELFAGYNWYATASVLHRLNKLIPSWLAALLITGRAMPPGNGSLKRRIYRMLELLSKNRSDRFADLRTELPKQYKSRLYSDDFLNKLKINSHAYLEQLYATHRFVDELDRMLYVDTLTYLPEELLVKVDRATMAHSLEGRSPLLDHELAELAARLPSHFKYRMGEKKRILKSVTARMYPTGFLNRPKSGFSVPLQAWFSSDLEFYARDRLLGGPLTERGFFKSEGIINMLHENKSGKRDHGDLIWRMLMLSEWFTQFR